MMRILKGLGYLVAVIVGLIVIGVGVIYAVSSAKLGKTYTVTVKPIVIPSDAASIARGHHIAETRGCIVCHGPDLGGAKVIENGAMGRLYGSNLTKGNGSMTVDFSDDDWVRAIRHGVAKDGHPLMLMPSAEFAHFTDEDLGSLLAYIRTVPPVGRETVPIKVGPVARGLIVAGKFKLAAAEIDHVNLMADTVKPGITKEYGHYMAAGCTGCHGPNYSGGKIDIGPPEWPPAANLTPDPSGHLSKWSEADFLRALRTAKRPDGTELNPVMPRSFGLMNDTELKAIWAYFQTLPPAATGTR
jgi:cytochrome c553